MTTPLYNFRLAPEKVQRLQEVARIVGASTTSEFLRDLIDAACSGEPSQMVAFQRRLVCAMGEQLSLPLASAPAPQTLTKPRRKPKRRRKERLRV